MNAAQKVDVLAVLDEMSSFMQISYPHYDSDEKLRAASAAVVKLIEAQRQIKRSIQQARIPGNDWRRELVLIENTVDATLARIGGAK